MRGRQERGGKVWEWMLEWSNQMGRREYSEKKKPKLHVLWPSMNCIWLLNSNLIVSLLLQNVRLKINIMDFVFFFSDMIWEKSFFFLHWEDHSYLNVIQMFFVFCFFLLISGCFPKSLTVLLSCTIWGLPPWVACAEKGTVLLSSNLEKNPFALFCFVLHSHFRDQVVQDCVHNHLVVDSKDNNIKNW